MPMNVYKMVLELAVILFVWFAFDWRVTGLVFLIMWWMNVAKDTK